MEDKLRKMMDDLGEKIVEHSCATCEFNFGSVCAGYGYEQTMERKLMECQ